MNKNKDELVSPRHPFIYMPLTHLKGVQSIESALFLLVIPISHCSFLTFYGVKSDDDWPPPFHSLGEQVCYIASELGENQALSEAQMTNQIFIYSREDTKFERND